ncbi:hypothetical protein HanIR_Chr09g0390781 [Helianthus annuus]|nr:hypothetical protein HanIR_Chr09g0390781 [Helianthus annuus]
MEDEPIEFELCKRLILGTILTRTQDRWVWEQDSDGGFSVSSYQKLLSSNAIPYYPFEWVK